MRFFCTIQKVLLLVIVSLGAQATDTQALNDLHYLKLLSNQGEVSLHLYNNNRSKTEFNVSLRRTIAQLQQTQESLLPKLELRSNVKLDDSLKPFIKTLELLTNKIEDNRSVGTNSLRKLNNEHNKFIAVLDNLSSDFKSNTDPEVARHARKGSSAILQLNRLYVYAHLEKSPSGSEPEAQADDIKELVDTYQDSYLALKNDGGIDKRKIRQLKKNWRFIEPSITGERLASVPFVVNRFSNEMVEEFVDISRDYE